MNCKKIIGLMVLGASCVAVAGIHDEPDGVSINMADDGSYKIISIGTGTYDFDDPDDILDARKEAERNAKANIAKFFKESLATEESASQQTSKIKKSSSDGKNTNTSVSKETAKETLSKIRSSSSALLTGVVVLEDEKIPSGNGGTYRVMVGVSSTTINAATSTANGMSDGIAAQGGSVAPTSAAGGTSAAAPAAAAGDAPAADASGIPLPPDGWITCVGVGSERKDAIQAALIEGISQVYGQILQNDERQVERMKKLKSNASIMGKELSATVKTKTKETESSTLTKTAGFVKEYRVIQVVPKVGNQEATIHAYIVNPRAGGTTALMVCKPTMTIEDKAKVYQLGPKKRLSGAEVATVVQFALPNGLAKANKFLILNDKSLETVVENKATTDAMVAAGLAGQQELMQASQGLTPDFSLRTEITEIAYSKKLGQDKKTKKFGQISKMTIKMNVTLMNDRTGQAVKSDSITLALDNDEITGLLAEDEDADLLQAAMSKLADPIEEWIRK